MARRRDWVLFGLAVAVQLVVLYLPRVDTGGLDAPGLDKVVHAAVFAAVAWTGRRAGLSGRLLVVLLVLQAVGSEVIQGQLLADRSGDPLDALADLVGVAIGTALPVTRRRPADEAASVAPGAASRGGPERVTR